MFSVCLEFEIKLERTKNLGKSNHLVGTEGMVCFLAHPLVVLLSLIPVVIKHARNTNTVLDVDCVGL